MKQPPTNGCMPVDESMEGRARARPAEGRSCAAGFASFLSILALAGCAGATIGMGGFGSGAGVGVGVSAPVGGYGDRAPYVVSEGEQVIRPGMTSSEVIQRLGQPFHRFGVRQDNATVWNYRMRYGSCLIYQVSILPSGIVKDAGTAPDPACDVPDRGRW